MSEDDTLYLVAEITHALSRECEALDKALKENLLDRERSENPKERVKAKARRSFYREMEWRIDGGLLKPDKAISALRRIVRQSDYFRVQVNNLLGAVSHDQTLGVKRELIQLESLLQEVVDLFEYLAAEKKIDIRLKIGDRPAIYGDRDLLHRMFVNLTDNAIKYSYSKAESSSERFINVDCYRYSTHNDWIVVFKSYGVRIEPEEISSGYLFKYGTRGKFAADRGRPGTGIGLAEAKRIADAHRAELKIESSELDGGNYLTLVKVIFRESSGR